MSIVLFNPTNEVLTGLYAGINTVLNPGDKIKVDDSRAHHILNNLGPRGLCTLEYGDDEEKRAEEGKARNLAFKKKQVLEYNQRNESRKMQGMSYHEPTKAVVKYGMELDIALNETYTMKDAEKAAISEAKRENIALKDQVDNLTNKLNAFLEKMAEKEIAAEVVEEPIKRKAGRPKKKIITYDDDEE